MTWLLVLLLSLPASASAVTIMWDRNADDPIAPTDAYQVYACWTLNCTAAELAVVIDATVPQPAPNVVPWWPVPGDKLAGRLAVTAVNVNGESGQSDSVTFGDKPFPRGLRLRKQ